MREIFLKIYKFVSLFHLKLYCHIHINYVTELLIWGKIEVKVSCIGIICVRILIIQTLNVYKLKNSLKLV